MNMESCSITAQVIPGGDIGADFASCRPASGEVVLWWLGQAGFMFKSRTVSWIIDPYLSDYLAHKYRGTRFPHTRLQAPPIAPGNLPPLDYYFCTHGHSDHMDPWTIQPIANRRTWPRFVVPGDSVPFDDLVFLLRERRPHVAFLPTNGRDDNRRVQGIPGNFTVDEAIAVCSGAEIPWLIPHHIEMFGFNTERRETVIRHLTEGDRRWILPELGVRYTVGAPES